MNEFPALTAAEAGRKFRDGSLTPLQLTEDLLARIQRENPAINAFYEVFAEEALDDAAAATRDLGEGIDVGPLQGIPVAIKDLFDVAGHVTTAGAHPGFRPPPARVDCDVVAHLRAAGAVLLGKTALHEWAFGVSNDNAHFGPTRNPHDLARIPGGSSGGSAAALAAGLTVLAMGTDTGGSIRIPAALCGVFGLKPTYGLVSLHGVTPLSRALDHAGPMARSVEDVFTLLEGISRFRREEALPPKILVPSNFFYDDVDPRIIELVKSAATKLGAPEEVDMGDVQAVWEANTVILRADAAAFHEERVKAHPDWFGGSLAERLAAGARTRAVDYSRARDVQREWTHRLEHLLGDEAVLAVPTTPVIAPRIGELDGAPLANLLTRLTAPFNLAGVPILEVPVGTVEGMPVGMQLVAAPGRESVLWAAARGGSFP